MAKQCVLILVITALFSSIAQGDIAKFGTFDIDGPEGIGFDIIPWSDPGTIYLWPFATSDTYTWPGSPYNLAQVLLSGGSFTVDDSDEKYGYLGIRIGNYTSDIQTFAACILTLDFIGSGSFDVYLPEFTFNANDNMFFWVAECGATYYANSLKGAGDPDMLADEAIAAGDEYLARIPEPATVLLLGLGGIALLKFNRRVRKAR